MNDTNPQSAYWSEYPPNPNGEHDMTIDETATRTMYTVLDIEGNTRYLVNHDELTEKDVLPGSSHSLTEILPLESH